MFLLQAVKHKSGVKRGEEMTGKEVLRQMVSSGLCESFKTLHFSFYIFSEQNPDMPITSQFLMLYCRRHLMVWGSQSFQSLRIVHICIHVV